MNYVSGSPVHVQETCRVRQVHIRLSVGNTPGCLGPSIHRDVFCYSLSVMRCRPLVSKVNRVEDSKWVNLIGYDFEFAFRTLTGVLISLSFGVNPKYLHLIVEIVAIGPGSFHEHLSIGIAVLDAMVRLGAQIPFLVDLCTIPTRTARPHQPEALL